MHRSQDSQQHPTPPIAAALDRLRRRQLYLLVSAVVVVVALIAGVAKSVRLHEPLNFILSDGRGYYVYLPSLMIDGDLDLRNQMLASFGADLNTVYHLDDVTERGYVADKYTVGVAMTLSPAFLAGHAIAGIGHAIVPSRWIAPDGYSLPYQVCCMLWIEALSFFSICLIDRIMDSEFEIRPRAIAAGVLAFWLGTHYLWYALREMFMSHLISLFWVSAIVWLCAVLRQEAQQHRRIRAIHLALLSAALGMALACRITNFFIIPVVFWMLAGMWRAGMMRDLIARAPALLPGAFPLALQALIWHIMTGHWMYDAYRGEHFVWAHPAMWQTLFSIRHKGLFTWSPMVFLAVIGLLWALLRGERAGRSLLIVWGLAGMLLWYFNSAWWYWSFGAAFGARSFLELGGLFALGLAMLFEQAFRSGAAALRAVAAAVAVGFLFNAGLMGLYQTRHIRQSEPLAGGWNPAGAPDWMFRDMEILRARAASGTQPTSR
jgi:hypothetical protein